MTRYLVRRCIQSAFILLAISLLSFAFMRAAPGGPGQFYDNPRISPAYREQLRRSFGLDDPLPLQYAKWLSNVMRFDFGVSFIDHRPVIEKIAERIPASFQLAIGSFLLGFLGVPLGVYAALRRGKLQDQSIRVFTVVGNALPDWWLGLMVLVMTSWIYSQTSIRIFPLGGMYSPGRELDLLDRLWHLALPSVIGAMGGWIVYSRYVRSGLLDVLGQDYVRTAHAKGLRASVVLNRHALRNALIPIATLFGGILTIFVSGALLYEITFSWPGMGRLFIDAAYQRDYPLLMAGTMIGSFLVIAGNLLSDLAYGWIDPRVRYD